MTFPNGYNFRKQLSLTSGGLTDYVSAPEDGIVVHAGSGTDSGDDVYLGGNCQDSFIDVILTDSSDNIIPFEWVYRKPGDYGRLIWSKSSVGATETLRLYYGKADATYQGDDVGTLVDRFNPSDRRLTAFPDYNDARGNYPGADGSIHVKNGFAYFAFTEEEYSGEANSKPRVVACKYDLFTRAIVEKRPVRYVGEVDEAHNHGALLVDNDGYVHCFCIGYKDGAGRGVEYAKSATPYELDFGPWAVIAASDQYYGAAYVRGFALPSGDLKVIFRDRSCWSIDSSDGGSNWTATEIVRHGTPGVDELVYGWPAQDPDTGDILLCYSFADSSTVPYDNEQLGFLWYDASASAWKDAAGTTQSLPVTSCNVDTNTAERKVASPAGPYLSAAGEFVFAHSQDATTAGGFFSGSIQIKVWNGSTWDSAAITSGSNDAYAASVRFWESGGTKYALIGRQVSASRMDWETWSASTWTGTWTQGSAIMSDKGNLQGAIFPAQIADAAPELMLFIDIAGGNYYFYDESAPAYNDGWTQVGNCEVMNGGVFARQKYANENQSFSRSIAAVAKMRVDFSLLHNRVDSSGSRWYGSFGFASQGGNHNDTGRNAAGIFFNGPSSPTQLDIMPLTRVSGSQTTPSTIYTPAIDEIVHCKITYDGSTLAAELYDTPELVGTALGTGSTAQAVSGLDTLGYGHSKNASGDSTRGCRLFFGPLRYYHDQSANAPVYDAWGAEEDGAAAHDLLGSDAEAAADADTAAASQTHGLAGTEIEAGAEADTGGTAQANELQSTDAEAYADADTGAASQAHDLAGTGVEAAADADTGAVAQAGELQGIDAEAQADTDTGAAAQVHDLAGTDIESGADADAGAASQAGELQGADAEAQTDADTGAATQAHDLAGTDIEAHADPDTGSTAPVVTAAGDDAEARADADTAGVSVIHKPVAADAEGQAAMDAAGISQSHDLAGSDAEARGEIPAGGLLLDGIGVVFQPRLIDVTVRTYLIDPNNPKGAPR